MKTYKKDGKIYHTGWIKIAGRWASKPTHEELIENGWEEVIPPTPTPSEPYEPTIEEQRQQIYLTEPLIDFEGKSLTVDEAKNRWTELMSEGDTDKAVHLRAKIAEAKAEVRARFIEQ